MSVTEQMKALLEEGDAGSDSEMKMVLPQLVSAMMSIGLDPQDDDNQDHFIAMLKMVVMNKAKLKKAMNSFTGAKAAKAVKVAKASL